MTYEREAARARELTSSLDLALQHVIGLRESLAALTALCATPAFFGGGVAYHIGLERLRTVVDLTEEAGTIHQKLVNLIPK